ncbi:hypothetical protein [Stenotrophomonas humi]
MKKMSAVLVLMGLSLPVVAQDASSALSAEVTPPQVAAPVVEPTAIVATEAPVLDAGLQNQWVEAPTEQENVAHETVTPDGLAQDVATVESAAAETTTAEVAGELASDDIAAGAPAAQAAATGTLTTAATVGFGIAAAAAIYSVVADSSDSSSSTASGGTTGTH